MQIQIISTSVETKTSKTGKPYQELEVVFKNLTYQGKVESKKLMPFGGNKAAFDALGTAQAGQTYEVTVVKNAQGYNDWTSVAPATAGAAPAAQAANKPAAAAARSTYETPEERAQRQILIVRQSSVSSAVAMLTAGAKAPPKLEDVLFTAQAISDYVFGVGKVDTGPTGFDDLPDFLPEAD